MEGWCAEAQPECLRADWKAHPGNSDPADGKGCSRAKGAAQKEGSISNQVSTSLADISQKRARALGTCKSSARTYNYVRTDKSTKGETVKAGGVYNQASEHFGGYQTKAFGEALGICKSSVCT